MLCYTMIKNKKELQELPANIKIGYSTYSFDFWPDTFATTEEAQGEFFPTLNKIGLKESSHNSIAGVNTLLHEILHGIVYQWSIEMGDKEEQTVNTLANGLTTVLVDNPWLISYIKKYV